jgi:hypothetical protein
MGARIGSRSHSDPVVAAVLGRASNALRIDGKGPAYHTAQRLRAARDPAPRRARRARADLLPRFVAKSCAQIRDRGLGTQGARWPLRLFHLSFVEEMGIWQDTSVLSRGLKIKRIDARLVGGVVGVSALLAEVSTMSLVIANAWSTPAENGSKRPPTHRPVPTATLKLGEDRLREGSYPEYGWITSGWRKRTRLSALWPASDSEPVVTTGPRGSSTRGAGVGLPTRCESKVGGPGGECEPVRCVASGGRGADDHPQSRRGLVGEGLWGPTFFPGQLRGARPQLRPVGAFERAEFDNFTLRSPIGRLRYLR